jgi:DNA-binding SARP family transcriptional activator
MMARCERCEELEEEIRQLKAVISDVVSPLPSPLDKRRIVGKELLILSALLKAPNLACSRERLIHAAWAEPEKIDADNGLYCYICRLRRLIKGAAKIISIRNSGRYKFEWNGDRQ